MSRPRQQWLVRIGKQESKPLSALQLRQLAAAGRIGPATLVRLASSDRWVLARQVRGLFAGITPDPRASALSDAQAMAVLSSPSTASSMERGPLPSRATSQVNGCDHHLRTGVVGRSSPELLVRAAPAPAAVRRGSSSDEPSGEDGPEEYRLAELPDEPRNVLAPRGPTGRVVLAQLTGTNSCPYCGGSIPVRAKKCKCCGEWLDKGEQMLRELVGGSYDRRAQELAPHRGGTILGLAVFGFFCLGIILGPVAWAMGSHDLREMEDGRMDCAGQGLTRLGQICGMIVTVLSAIGMLVILGGGMGR